MPRIAANGAVVSDNGQWYFNGFKWQPLVEGASSKPGLREVAAANKLSSVNSALAGKRLARLAAEHGSLEAAEASLGDAEAAGQKQLLKTYKSAAEFEADFPLMQAKGWRLESQEQGNAHTTAGRVGTGIVVGGVLTGGVGAVIGGALGAASKRKGAVTVVYER